MSAKRSKFKAQLKMSLLPELYPLILEYLCPKDERSLNTPNFNSCFSTLKSIDLPTFLINTINKLHVTTTDGVKKETRVYGKIS